MRVFCERRNKFVRLAMGYPRQYRVGSIGLICANTVLQLGKLPPKTDSGAINEEWDTWADDLGKKYRDCYALMATVRATVLHALYFSAQSSAT